jgi:hypothetical protein
VLQVLPASALGDLDDVVAVDREARDWAQRFVGNGAALAQAAASG